MQVFKKGISHLAQKNPTIPIVPVFFHGLGKSLPKGEGLLVPFFCDIFVGKQLHWKNDRAKFMQELEETFRTLSEEKKFSSWN